MIDLNTNLLWLLVGTFAALCVGTLMRMFALRNAEPELARKRMGSLKVWWTLAALMGLAVVFGRPGAAVLLAVTGSDGADLVLGEPGAPAGGAPPHQPVGSGQ